MNNYTPAKCIPNKYLDNNCAAGVYLFDTNSMLSAIDIQFDNLHLFIANHRGLMGVEQDKNSLFDSNKLTDLPRPVNLFHIASSDVQKVESIINKTKKKFLSGEYSEYFIENIVDSAFASIIGLRPLVNNGALLVTTNITSKTLDDSSLLSFYTHDVLTYHKIKPLNALEFDSLDTSGILEQLGFYGSGAGYFHQLVVKDQEARHILSQRDELHQRVPGDASPSKNKPSLANPQFKI